MPVFHTKTIENILEPVAQQVSFEGLLNFESQNNTSENKLKIPLLM
ncbi:hypothetical protein CAEBREN_31904 [Caenorhabditis brenneri]|uniref:Uncharacterized protein n=1 Tax=Caenorhabditis brenneri TaxID=135651 RepID=G0PHD6_CAEBE|nr:hypothetical protein CAEBREN_31904 [Caenorhabditis brenneri]